MSSFVLAATLSKLAEYTTIIALVQAVIAIILNALLLFISKSCYVRIGNYKRFIVAYGVLDIVLCICHALITPVRTIFDVFLILL